MKKWMRQIIWILKKKKRLRSKDEATEAFKEIGFFESEETEDGEVSLKQSFFKWDKLCPLFLSCIPLDRSQFAKSILMKDRQFIMQVFCWKIAFFSKWNWYLWFACLGSCIHSGPSDICTSFGILRSGRRRCANTLIVTTFGCLFGCIISSQLSC